MGMSTAARRGWAAAPALPDRRVAGGRRGGMGGKRGECRSKGGRKLDVAVFVDVIRGGGKGDPHVHVEPRWAVADQSAQKTSASRSQRASSALAAGRTPVTLPAGRSSPRQELPRDHDALDLVRALVDLGGLDLCFGLARQGWQSTMVEPNPGEISPSCLGKTRWGFLSRVLSRGRGLARRELRRAIVLGLRRRHGRNTGLPGEQPEHEQDQEHHERECKNGRHRASLSEIAIRVRFSARLVFRCTPPPDRTVSSCSQRAPETLRCAALFKTAIRTDRFAEPIRRLACVGRGYRARA